MDPDAELKKQIDLLRDSLIVLSTMENKSSQRIRDHEDRLLEQENLTAKHTQWLLDHEIATKRHDEFLTRHAESMSEFDQKLNAIIVVMDDLIRGKRQ